MGTNPSVAPPYLSKSGHPNRVENTSVLEDDMPEDLNGNTQVDPEIYAIWAKDSQAVSYSHTDDADNAAGNDNDDMDNDNTTEDEDLLESQSLPTRPTSPCIIKSVHLPTAILSKPSTSKISSAKVLPAAVPASKKTTTDTTKKRKAKTVIEVDSNSDNERSKKKKKKKSQGRTIADALVESKTLDLAAQKQFAESAERRETRWHDEMMVQSKYHHELNMAKQAEINNRLQLQLAMLQAKSTATHHHEKNEFSDDDLSNY